MNFKISLQFQKTESAETQNNLTMHGLLSTYQNDKILRGRKTDLFGLLACAGKP